MAVHQPCRFFSTSRPPSHDMPDNIYSPLIIVARPRAAPIPLPFMAFGPTLLNIGACCSISGTTMKRIMLPLIYTLSKCDCFPSLAVKMTSLREQLRLSSASKSFPRYDWPPLSSRVTTWPTASWRSFVGIPIVPIVACEDVVFGVWIPSRSHSRSHHIHLVACSRPHFRARLRLRARTPAADTPRHAKRRRPMRAPE